MPNKDETFLSLVSASESPSAEWRSAPFWALNGDLNPDEIRKQIRGFQKNGMGGFYLHARTGLKTPYLSDKWFECVDAAVDEAKKLNMQAWLYDEDRFPSGFGGGLITCDPKYRAKGITLKEVPFSEAADEKLPETTLAVFSGAINGVHAENVRKLDKNNYRNELKEGETLLVFYTDTVARSIWYNDYTYLDTLSVEAVRKFIDLTHEAYAKRYSSDFGGVIPGIFTDEPRYGFMIDQPFWDSEHRKMLPWTEGLLEDFKNTYHYDALDHCPEFFYEVAGADSVAPRVHYVSTMLKFFKRAFWEPIGKWCKDRNLRLTGHPVAEDSLSYQTLGIGSAMQLYEHMGMPGIDLLSEHHRAYQAAKQLSSAARQFGKKRRLVEIYGCTGWDFSSAGIKALGDWVYALGVNYRCEHLAFYSIEGEAKRDYPGPVALQTNTPDTYRSLNDYFARLSIWLSSGKEDRRILVISAIESAWTMIHQGWREEKKTLEYDRDFVELSHNLLANQLDFDYGEEEILSQLAKVNGNTFTVGEAEYKVIIVPQLITIRKTTLELLNQFQAAGGLVLTFGEKPGYLDAVKQDFIWNFPKINSYKELIEAVRPYSPVFVQDAENTPCTSLLNHIRRGMDWDVLYLCNTGHAIDKDREHGEEFIEPGAMERLEVYPSVTVSFETAYSGELVEFDPFTGKFHPVKAEYDGFKWKIHTDFGRLATRTFFAVREKGLAAVVQPEPTAEGMKVRQTVSPDKWEIELSEENVAVLDHFCTETIKEPMYVLALDDKLHEDLGMEVRNFMMPQPWCRKMDMTAGGYVDFFADFECQAVPAENICLVLERPKLYQITLNGRNITLNDAGSWHASGWRKVEIPAELLQAGQNRFAFRTKLTYAHPGLESMFLTGNFGVKANGNGFILTEPVRELALGDWTAQGLPFYPGEVIYKTRVSAAQMKHAAVRIPEYAGTPAKIEINGIFADRMLFSPGTTKELSLPADFELKITVTGSMRNACGPFFMEKENLPHYGPMCYKLQERKLRRIITYGLLSAPELLERQD